jgi:hypothetical protein
MNNNRLSTNPNNQRELIIPQTEVDAVFSLSVWPDPTGWTGPGVRKLISLSRVLVFSIGWIILAFIFLIFDPLALFNVFPPLLIGGADQPSWKEWLILTTVKKVVRPPLV